MSRKTMSEDLLLKFAKQAGLRGISETQLSQAEINFAEIIIKYCADICVKPYWLPEGGHGLTDREKRCAIKIKEHFGLVH